ncbi:hypothetical protein [Cellulomonas sp. C5510]|uniref:hypothetical protein n=1 Tax=Cellulomonas sp. C5510 TaxID=2871170 RepID=UPI001C98DC6E|nr:hypothetical protein [Cellulomonas sp. C5510]QZN86818.1 hypothetical protein K5O09_06805 [Cellulomonas sp. C5510]
MILLAAALVTSVVLVRWDVVRTRRVETALAELDRAAASLTVARRDGSAALAASAGRVNDQRARRDLSALLVGLPTWDPPGNGSPQARAERAGRQAGAVRARVVALTDATAVVREEHARWLLATATAERMAVHASLGAAVAEAGAALVASEGRVLDDAPRAALRAAVHEAGTARQAGAQGPRAVGASAERLLDPRPTPRTGGRARAVLDAAEARATVLREETAVLRSHVDRLAAARAAVGTAESAWQAEQDRRAAEREAAERAARVPARATGSGPRSAPGRGPGGSPAAGGAGGSAASPGPSTTPTGLSGAAPELPPGWTTVVETEGGAWCGDEFGASWEC